MDIWTAILSVPAPILVAILIILIIMTVYIVYQNAKMRGLDGIRAQAYQYMLMAEHIYLSGEGRKKLKYVVSRARGLLPGWMQFFITDEALMKIIDMWFAEVKDLLDDGKINDSADLEEDPDEDE